MSPAHLVDDHVHAIRPEERWEIIAAPLTYRVVAFLKHAENEDYYDIDTNFTPVLAEGLSLAARVFIPDPPQFARAAPQSAPELRG